MLYERNGLKCLFLQGNKNFLINMRKSKYLRIINEIVLRGFSVTFFLGQTVSRSLYLFLFAAGRMNDVL